MSICAICLCFTLPPKSNFLHILNTDETDLLVAFAIASKDIPSNLNLFTSKIISYGNCFCTSDRDFLSDILYSFSSCFNSFMIVRLD